MARLSNATLSQLRGDVERPTYDRAALKVGIVHFGVGAFHRSHQAMYLNALMNRGEALDWAICGVGLLPGDRRMKDVLDEQDGLYTLTLKHPDGSREPAVIGSIAKYLFGPDDPEAVLVQMSDPNVRIVSLTITEGGYNFDRVTGEFDSSNPGVVADLKPGATPLTVFAYVTEALRRRRDAGIAPFTVQSCDNIQGNGEVAKRMFSAFARLKDAALADWIEEHVLFPNSMVDRITPVTAPADIEEVERLTGLRDEWPVVSEPFCLWVIEDHFPQGRPRYEDVGCLVVEDVAPYEMVKLRLLNAAHQGIAYFGYLSGLRYVHETMQDPAILGFIRKYWDNEAVSTLPLVPGFDVQGFKNGLVERFGNPEVRDTLARLCAESSDRIPKWLLPVVRDNLTTGGEIDRSAAIVASWARYAEGIDEQGELINVVDPLKDQLIPIAKSQRENRFAFIENENLFGDLAKNARFREAYLWALNSIIERGAQVTVVDLA